MIASRRMKSSEVAVSSSMPSAERPSRRSRKVFAEFESFFKLIEEFVVSGQSARV